MEFPVIVKKRQALFPLFAVISAAMLGVSLLFLFFPFIDTFSDALGKKTLGLYAATGGAGTLFFSFCFFCFVFGMVFPPVGLKLTESGLYDYTVAGVGAGFIPGDAILSLRTFGDGRTRYLGIKVDTERLETLPNDKKLKREIENNVNSGLPAIIIKQCDVAVPVGALLHQILDAYSAKPTEQNTDEPAPPTSEISKQIEELFDTSAENQSGAPPETPEVQGALTPDADGGAENLLLKENGASDVTEDDIVFGQSEWQSHSPGVTKDDNKKNENVGVPAQEEKTRIKSVDELLRQLNIIAPSGSAQDENAEKKNE